MSAQAEFLNPTIKAVHAITTGHVEQHKEHRYGTSMPLMWWVLTSTSWVKAPITAYAIEHRDGLVLFDTGLDPDLVSDPDYISSPIGLFLLKKIFRFHIGPEDALDKQLDAINLASADVSKVILSHLHFDHIGGIAHVPQAELIVSQDEWQRLYAPHPERDWILREHIDLPGANWQPVEFEPTSDPLLASFGVCYDCMGDGSMILLPTPGHTPGSMSMLVRGDGLPPFMFVGDLTYELEALPDLILLPSHDPLATETLAKAFRQHQHQGR